MTLADAPNVSKILYFETLKVSEIRTNSGARCVMGIEAGLRTKCQVARDASLLGGLLQARQEGCYLPHVTSTKLAVRHCASTTTSIVPTFANGIPQAP